MSKVSVIIPARNEPWLQKTIDDLFAKAKGEIEVIAVLDGYWPDPILKDDPRLVLVHNSQAEGMRSALNYAAKIATGKYLMKLDAHCMVEEGYDTILQEGLEYDWLSVPSRYSLDAEKWERKRKPPTDYLFLTFPYISESQFGTGLHGKKWVRDNYGPDSWWWKERTLKGKLIDEIIIWQGSCWFVHRQKYYDIDMLDTKYSYNMFQEANELAFKIWLSGGKVIVNKKTWYAHWHKDEPTGYGLTKQAKYATERTSTWFWMNDKWKKRTRDLEWLIDKFMPLPGWPDNWKDVKKEYEAKHPEIWGGQNIRVFDEKGWEGISWT